MNKLHTTLIGCCMVLSVVSCTDIIVLEPLSEPNNNVVIHGRLTVGEPSEVFVQVSRFRPVDLFVSSSPVAVREVALIDLQDDIRFPVPVSTQRRGFYGLIDEGTFPVEVGRSYQLEVVLESGERYTSTPQSVYQVPPPRNLTFSVEEERGETAQGIPFTQMLVSYRVETEVMRSDGQGAARMRWRPYGTFKVSSNPGDTLSPSCYPSFEVKNGPIPLFNGADLTVSPGETVQLETYRSTVNFRYAEGFLLTLFQESLSEEAYRYFDQVSRVINREATIAADPVGEVQGNMRRTDQPDEVVYGLFYATTVDSISTFVTPDDVGNPGFFCPQPAGGGGGPAVNLCTDCQEAWKDGPVQFTEPANWGG